jgi:hypothetical protein
VGVQDRDYMRRGSPPSPPPRQARHNFPAAQPQWLRSAGYVAIFLIVGAFLFKAARDYVNAREAVPFPDSGAVHWYTVPTDPGRSQLTVTAPSGSRLQYAVRLNDWDSGKPVLLVPVRAGDTARVDVPLGRYRVTIIRGRNWRGPGRYFGTDARTDETVYPLEFYRVDNSTTGHTLKLDADPAGNLETRPARN